MARIHILGASGSGTTTLGAALAGSLGVPHFDTDAFFWVPTDPPFTTQRPVAERLGMLKGRLSALPGWILSGSATGWGDPLVPLYDLIVFLTLDPALRMERLRRREEARYAGRIAQGGDMAEGSAAFLAWAAAYDTAGSEQRSRVGQERWLAAQAVPVLRLDSSAPVAELLSAVVARLPEEGRTA
ncbi:hypothetical protein [Roseomonas indoligenes]|uniref:Adenylate kinase n=1 Tax=Roseomonas indoligenes TaxID=2820811 RepID=A0A940S4I2_9PROT|nr:hypothetical protein [Pararoseomonas indoligenes]MBP0492010.1 hypothetical protein [Pararoseomonas indoligenes]